MESSVDKLRHYADDQLALVSWVYVASEGMIRIHVRPKSSVETVAYAVGPGNGYFKFIPVKRRVMEGDELQDSRDDEVVNVEPEPVRLKEVIVGELYEVIITNYASLYRYRLGDVVKVSGFYNSTPEHQFVGRKGVVLNIRNDKTTESDLQLAMERASKLFLEEEKVDIVDFMSYDDLSTEPDYYVIF